MRNRYYAKKRRYSIDKVKIAKRLVFLIAVCIIVYLFPAGAEYTLSRALMAPLQNGTFSDFILKTGLGLPYNTSFSPLSFFFPQLKTASGGDAPAQDSSNGDTSYTDETQPEPSGDETETDNTPQSADNSNIIPTTMTGEGSSRYQNIGGVYLKNNTEYSLDDSIASGADITLSSDGPQVLIIHTHGSESYTPDGDDVYEESDPSRTEDKNYNMVRIGDELAELLESRGIGVIHDRELYDYPSYTGSYGRSLEAAKEYISKYPSIKIVLDIHRDALEGDGVTYKTVANLDGYDPCSQIMLVVGTDYSGLEHDNWRENLKFAVTLQKAMDEKYPTLARPITISSSRYNQHLTEGALIVEVGTNGNTLKESLTAIRLFGDVASDVLLSYEN